MTAAVLYGTACRRPVVLVYQDAGRFNGAFTLRLLPDL